MPSRRAVLASLLLCFPAAAGEKAPAPRLHVPKLDLGFAPIPNGDELKANTAPREQAERAEVRPDEEGISVLRVEHGRGVIRSALGARAKNPLGALLISGRPKMTEPFTTIVRVKSSARQDLAIDVRIVDPRGVAVLTSEGTVGFRGSSHPEQDYVVEWSPVALRGGGAYIVEVSLDRRPMGRWPLEVRSDVEPPTSP